MKKKVGLAVLLVVVLVLSSLFAFGGVFAKQPANDGGKPLTILVAGYGWYRGIPEGQINNAETIALALDGEMIFARDASGTVIAKGKVHSIVIPVTWYGAWPPVAEAIEELNPDIVLGLGTGGSLTIEKWGSNLMNGTDADPEDPSQEVTMDHVAIDPGGPDWRTGSLPYDAMVLAMLEAGIPARRGYQRGYSSEGYPRATPGWYLCNFFTYYGPMYVEENELDIDIGFIHVWNRPEYRAGPRYETLTDPNITPDDFTYWIERSHSSSMEITRTINAIRIGLQECVRARAGF